MSLFLYETWERKDFDRRQLRIPVQLWVFLSQKHLTFVLSALPSDPWCLVKEERQHLWSRMISKREHNTQTKVSLLCWVCRHTTEVSRAGLERPWMHVARGWRCGLGLGRCEGVCSCRSVHRVLARRPPTGLSRWRVRYWRQRFLRSSWTSVLRKQ